MEGNLPLRQLFQDLRAGHRLFFSQGHFWIGECDGDGIECYYLAVRYEDVSLEDLCSLLRFQAGMINDFVSGLSPFELQMVGWFHDSDGEIVVIEERDPGNEPEVSNREHGMVFDVVRR